MADFNIEKYFEGVKPVPRALPGGGQEGVVPPAKRKYNAQYGVVSGAEAVSNMVARMNGKMKPIANGLDTPGEASVPPKQVPPMAKKEAVAPPVEEEPFDPVEAPVDPVEELEAEPEIPETDMGLSNSMYVPDPAKTDKAVSMKSVPRKPKTQMVTMEVRQEHEDGTFSTFITVGLPVIKVEQDSNCLALISPVSEDQCVFMPAAGSDILLSGAGLNSTHVFYPGTRVTLYEHGISVMCFVKAK